MSESDPDATVEPTPDQASRSQKASRAGPLLPHIEGYEVLSELGRGGMGVVYKAKHRKLGRIVALKMILSGGQATEVDLQRFQTEAEAVARLQHPGIVQVFDIGEHEGLPFFSLEFCEGGSLAAKMAGTPLPPNEAAVLVEQVARAVQAAHEHKILHRDLKPANILLAACGLASDAKPQAALIPKVTDFGLAKKLDEASQTASGAVMGTPSYMAPEQTGGKASEVGPLADVYALGAILYECLTGRPPFRAATALDTLLQVSRDEPVPPRQLNPKVPVDLETICLKCLRKEPANRYDSAARLAEDLKRFLDEMPILARPMAWPERLARWARRRPAVAALLSLLILVVTGGLTATTLLWIQADQQRRVADDALRDADEERRAAESARDAADRSHKRAEDALVASRQRLALNYLAYGRACAVASRLANTKDWQEGEADRQEFQRLSAWIAAVGDPVVKQALDRFRTELEQWNNGPAPPLLQSKSLQLAHACRDSWLNTIEKEFPSMAGTIRDQLYSRACEAAGQLAAAKNWADSRAARQEFWELYWGELAIVESPAVARVMVRIGDTLKAWRPEAPAPNELRLLAVDLRQACGR